MSSRRADRTMLVCTCGGCLIVALFCVGMALGYRSGHKQATFECIPAPHYGVLKRRYNAVKP
jgi:hypothetical protein